MINAISKWKRTIKPKYLWPRRLKESTRREKNYNLWNSPVETLIELSKKAIKSKIL